MTYTNKTQPTTISAEKYLKKYFGDKENIQKDAQELIEIYSKISGSPCVMWNKIFGFGKYYYLDSKGGKHEFLMTGFTISSTGFTLYNIMGWNNYKDDIAMLGKYKLSGKSCLAIKKVSDIDLQILTATIKKSISDIKKKYKTES